MLHFCNAMGCHFPIDGDLSGSMPMVTLSVWSLPYTLDFNCWNGLMTWWIIRHFPSISNSFFFSRLFPNQRKLCIKFTVYFHSLKTYWILFVLQVTVYCLEGTHSIHSSKHCIRHHVWEVKGFYTYRYSFEPYRYSCPIQIPWKPDARRMWHGIFICVGVMTIRFI